MKDKGAAWIAQEVEWMAWAGSAIQQQPELFKLILFITHTGDGLFLFILGILLWLGGVMWWGSFWQLVGTRLVLVVIVAIAVSGVLKQLVRRSRPPGKNLALYSGMDLYSFPSGHATRIGALLVVLGAIFPPWGTIGLLIWGSIICFTRIALGVHFPTDILGGLLCGAVAGVLVLVRF
jgi:undecaprenyl-diphosphatase